jgi:hypothetical protein
LSEWSDPQGFSLFDHLGNQEQAVFHGRGTLLVGFALVGLAGRVLAQSQAMSDNTTTGWANGVMPVVSTARICSTMSKKMFICVSMRSLSEGASSSAPRLAMRAISVDVSDMVRI